MFGARKRRARELAHEILRPLGVEVTHLKEHSRQEFEAQIADVVRRDQDDELYRRQTGWSKGER